MQIDGQLSLWEYLPQDTVEDKAKRDWEVLQKMITRVLKRGSGFEGGKERIYKAVVNTTTNKELADIIKAEYGCGGSSGMQVEHLSCKYYDSNSDGLRITTDSKYYPVHTLRWLDVAQRVRLLVTKGDYV